MPRKPQDETTDEMTTTETPDAAAPAWSMDQMKAIVSAGMTVTEARMLRDEGYSADAVMELAEMQRTQRTSAAVDTQTATAKAMQKAMKPENEFHPAISVFSYPEGDRLRPKALPFEFFYNGYPCHKFLETQLAREVELMAQVRPGTYTVVCKDNSTMKVEVTAERNASDVITKIDVRFPVSRETKFQIPPVLVLLYQIVHTEGDPRRRFIEAMQEFMNVTMLAVA